MNYSDVKDLINLISSSPYSKFELELDNAKIKIEKPVSGTVTSTQEMFEASGKEVKVKAVETVEKVEVDHSGFIVTSPMVGTFYKSSSPDKPAFFSVGETVQKGNIICIIEAMKIMNEILSQQDGVVAEVFVNDGDMVEFGQPLFRIK